MFKKKCPSCGTKNTKERTTCIECGVPFGLEQTGGQVAQVSKLKTIDEADRIVSNRNRLVSVAVGLFILAILSGQIFQIPISSTHIFGDLFVGNVIKFVIAVIMFVMVISVRHRLAPVAIHYARQSFKIEERPNSTITSSNIDGLSTEFANIVIIIVIWPIVNHGINQLMLIGAGINLGWISTIVNLSFIGILLSRLYKGYKLLHLS